MLYSIQEGILPGEAMELYGDEPAQVFDCSSFWCDSFKLICKMNVSLYRGTAGYQDICVSSQCGAVLEL